MTSGHVWLQPDGTFSFISDTFNTEAEIIVQGKFEASTSVSGDFIQHIECLSATGELLDGDLSIGAFWKAEWVAVPEKIITPKIDNDKPGPTDTFSEPGSIDVRSLAIDLVTPTTMYAGTPGGVFKSTDDGGQWSDAIEGTSYSYANVLVIDPSAPETRMPEHLWECSKVRTVQQTGYPWRGISLILQTSYLWLSIRKHQRPCMKDSYPVYSRARTVV